MAKDEKAVAQGKSETAFVRPEIGVNLTQQYPLYDGGDARTDKVGHAGPPVHGRLLGILDLPSPRMDADGNPQAWEVFVIELLQDAPACPPGDESVTQWYHKGDRIAFTITTALQRFKALAQDVNKIYEIVIEPKVGRTKSGNSLWLYNMGIVKGGENGLKREPQHRFSTSDFVQKALGVNGASVGNRPAVGSGMPSDDRFA
jgi:hypothetical protein